VANREFIQAVRLVCAGTAILLGGSAAAHHGAGTFDRNSSVDYEGTISGVDFVNPHAWVYFDVVNADGETERHRCEMRAATVLKRSGWSESMFVAGERVRIEGRGDRFDPYSCYLTTITFADGTSADRYGQIGVPGQDQGSARPQRLAGGEPNISGDWASEQLVMTDPSGRGGALVPLSTVDQFEPGEGSIGDPTAAGQGGARQYRTRSATLTDVGQAAADAFGTYDPEDNPRMRCETTSILFDWTFDGPVNRITQAGDTIRIQYGQLGFERSVHMNLDEHPEGVAPSRAGHSIGRWEGDELVVDTVGFEPGVLSPPILHSDQLHVVERFSLDTETLTLHRRYVATDPVYFVGEYVGEDFLQVADIPYDPDVCRELTFVDYSEAQE
jgi:hypothetical protein